MPLKPPTSAFGRNVTVDCIRGLLALHVFTEHFFERKIHGYAGFPFGLAGYSVWGFFALSAYVLCRSWDGNFFAFLVRRLVRLWPLYALCLTLGYLGLGQAPEPLRYVFLPVQISPPPAVDPPSWSLTVEWWAMMAMPLYVWAARGPYIRVVGLMLLCIPLALWVDGRLINGQFFIFGAFLSRFEIRWRLLETRFCIWLGQISFPLYLSQWLVQAFLPVPLPLQILAAFGLAQLLTWTVEAWSIKWSRKAGEFVLNYRLSKTSYAPV